jgi:hypothetical protein
METPSFSEKRAVALNFFSAAHFLAIFSQDISSYITSGRNPCLARSQRKSFVADKGNKKEIFARGECAAAAVPRLGGNDAFLFTHSHIKGIQRE